MAQQIKPDWIPCLDPNRRSGKHCPFLFSRSPVPECLLVSLFFYSVYHFSIYVWPLSSVSFSSTSSQTLGERVLASGSVQLPRFTLLESGSLLISPSHISDAGTYTCMASNSRGIDEASADLGVWGECAGLDGRVLSHPFKKYTCLILCVLNAQDILHKHPYMEIYVQKQKN